MIGLAIERAARELAARGRVLHLAAIPADGSLVPTGEHPAIDVHCDLPAALAAHTTADGHAEGRQQWRTSGWPE